MNVGVSMRWLLGLVLVPCALSACGRGGETVRSGASGLCLPIAPMRLLALEHGREWEPMAELRGDGTIATTFSRRPSQARIVGDRIEGARGYALQCTTDGVLHLQGSPLTMRFDERGVLTDGQRMQLFVGDDGGVVATMNGGPMRPMGWRVEGVTPATRRTAEVLVFAAIAGIDWGGGG